MLIQSSIKHIRSTLLIIRLMVSLQQTLTEFCLETRIPTQNIFLNHFDWVLIIKVIIIFITLRWAVAPTNDANVPIQGGQTSQHHKRHNLGWTNVTPPTNVTTFKTLQTLRTTNVTMCRNIFGLHLQLLTCCFISSNISLCISQLDSKLIPVIFRNKKLFILFLGL